MDMRSNPQVSPDGKKIAFAGNIMTNTFYQASRLFVMNSQTGQTCKNAYRKTGSEALLVFAGHRIMVVSISTFVRKAGAICTL